MAYFTENVEYQCVAIVLQHILMGVTVDTTDPSEPATDQFNMG